MEIRHAKKSEYKEIGLLIREAFEHSEYGYNDEADLVNRIRMGDSYVPELELVAVEDEKIVGHGLLSEVEVVSQDTGATVGLALAPIEVATAYQGKKIGGALLTELEKKAKNLHYPFIAILGDPEYYSKYGYRPAKNYAIDASFDVPDEFFMIKPLAENALDKLSGTVKYPKAFD